MYRVLRQRWRRRGWENVSNAGTAFGNLERYKRRPTKVSNIASAVERGSQSNLGVSVGNKKARSAAGEDHGVVQVADNDLGPNLSLTNTRNPPSCRHSHTFTSLRGY
jgi:hypothetical protein